MSYEKNIIKQCYKSGTVLAHCKESIPTELVFEDPLCQLFWKVFVSIHDHLSIDTISIALSNAERLSCIKDFNQLIGTPYHDEDQWKFQLHFVLRTYRYKLLVTAAAYVNTNIHERPSTEIYEHIKELLEFFEIPDNKSVSMVSAIGTALKDMRSRFAGTKATKLETGFKELDKNYPLDPFSKLILVAAEKKIGKTRLMVQVIKNILSLNKNIAVQWISLEMAAEELVRCFVSELVSMTEDELLNRSHKPVTREKMAEIETACSLIEDLNIEFVDEPMNIFNIEKGFLSFKKKHTNENTILVIDNLGFITPHSNNDQKNDEDVSRKLKEVRDKTQANVFLLHHLTKAASRSTRIEDGYQPRLEDVRGTTRILDFANIVWLLHRPNYYKDFMERFLPGMESKEAGLLKRLFLIDVALNRSGTTGLVRLQHDIQFSRFKNF